MKIAQIPRKITTLIGAIGLTAAAAIATNPLPAQAYSVYLNGKTAGNPAGPLYNIDLFATTNPNDIDDLGRTLDPIKWYVPAGVNGSSLPYDLSATMGLTVQNLTASYLQLLVSVTNTTVIPTTGTGANTNAAITSLGFGVSPNATGVQITQNSSTTVFEKAIVQSGQQNFPGGFKQIDVCVLAANNCAGGNVNQGLQAGQSTSFILKIFGNFTTPTTGKYAVTLSDTPIKFQTAYGSFEPASVPEPFTILGSGLALGFGAAYRRKLSKKNKKAAVKMA